MTSVSITNSLLAKLKPQEKAYDIRDSRLKGFIVRVQPSGSMSFVVQYARGKRVNLGRTGVITPVQAREKAIKILAECANGMGPKQVNLAKKNVPTLSVFLTQEYGPWVKAHNLSGEDAIKTIHRHFAHLMDTPIDQIKAQDIDKWRTKKIESRTMKANTINRTVTPLRSVITKAVEWGVISEHGLSGLKILKYDDTRIRYLSTEENSRLFQALESREEQLKAGRKRANTWRSERGYSLYPVCDDSQYFDHLFPMIIVAMNTGIRRGELFNLKRRHINLEQATLFVEKSKNYLARYVPLNKTALKVLVIWLKQSEYLYSDYLFPSPADVSKPISSIKTAWTKLLKEAAIDDLRWHDLRHDFASNLVMKEVSLYAVQKLLGHKKMDQTMKYAHLASDFIAESVARLDG